MSISKTATMLIATTGIVTCTIISAVHAQTPQQTFDQNMQNASEVSQRQQQEQQKEQMRDKSHDNRLMINKDTTVGVSAGGVNVRTTKGQ